MAEQKLHLVDIEIDGPDLVAVFNDSQKVSFAQMYDAVKRLKIAEEELDYGREDVPWDGYWFVDVTVDGTSILHGPFRTQIKAKKQALTNFSQYEYRLRMATHGS